MKHETSSETTVSTRDRILDEARRQIAQQGFSRLTVVGVAKALNLTHAAVYRHFASKQALIDVLIDDWLSVAIPKLEALAAKHKHAAEGVSEMLIAETELKRDAFRSDKSLFDAFEEITSRRPDAARTHLAAVSSLIEQTLLADDTLEMDALDAARLADLIVDATETHRHPLLIDLSDDAFAGRIASTVRALIAGRHAI